MTAAFGSREAVAPASLLRVAVIVIENVAAALVCAAGGCGWRRRGCESGSSGWWCLSRGDRACGLVRSRRATGCVEGEGALEALRFHRSR